MNSPDLEKQTGLIASFEEHSATWSDQATGNRPISADKKT